MSEVPNNPSYLFEDSIQDTVEDLFIQNWTSEKIAQRLKITPTEAGLRYMQVYDKYKDLAEGDTIWARVEVLKILKFVHRRHERDAKLVEKIFKQRERVKAEGNGKDIPEYPETEVKQMREDEKLMVAILRGLTPVPAAAARKRQSALPPAPGSPVLNGNIHRELVDGLAARVVDSPPPPEKEAYNDLSWREDLNAALLDQSRFGG